MGNMGNKFVLMEQAGGEQGGAGGSGGGGGSPAGGAAPAFADASAARTFLKEYVPGEDYLKAFDDTKVVPFATHIKSKVDEFGKQFPASWRNMVAGENPEQLKTLERFQSPKALYESYAALRSKMADGSLRPVEAFPDKGTPEQQAAWRVTNGVPESADGYVKSLKLPEGMQVGDADKPVLESLAKAAHAGHFPQSQVDSTMAWFLSEQGARTAAKGEMEANSKAASEDALRAEWGPDYRPNIARIQGLLDMAPKGVKEMLDSSYTTDGKRVMNDPVTLGWLVGLSRQLNPAGVQLPGSGGSLQQSVEEEIRGIEKVMKTDRQAYNKDEKKQGRLRDLYEAYEKTTGKAWAG